MREGRRGALDYDMSFWDRLMPKHGDSNYQYHFAHVEKHKEQGDKMRSGLWDVAERTTLVTIFPPTGTRAHEHVAAGFHNEYAMLLEHRGQAVSSGPYQVIPREHMYKH